MLHTVAKLLISLHIGLGLAELFLWNVLRAIFAIITMLEVVVGVGRTFADG